MSLVDKAFDVSEFRNEAHALVDLLSRHFETSLSGESPRVFSWKDPEDQYAYWADQPEGRPTEAFFQDFIDQSLHMHNPRYMGHQAAMTAFTASLAGFLGDALNNLPSVYEMGGPGVALERLVVERTAKVMGFGPGSGGFLTSGGSLGNLTALLCARANMAEEVWQEGTQKQYAVMVSEQAHYCVERAARMMGWGAAGVIKIPSDANYAMRTDLLDRYFEEARAAGKTVIAVIGSSCSTATGSYDDLEEIASFCQQRQLWFHVDGAHGAPVVFSDTYRHLVKGLNQADSVVMDFHKSMMVPALATAVVFKDGRTRYRTFAQKASYLWRSESAEEWFHPSRATFETSKASISLKVWALWQKFGDALFAEYIERTYDNARLFARLVKADCEFSLPVEPAANIVCFRYLQPGKSERDLDVLNQRIRETLMEDGRFFLVRTELRGRTFLRVTLMNPYTGDAELRELLDAVKVLGQTFSPTHRDKRLARGA
ncbi:pyridoxal phosphate-dependent decarboxylase family protein [Acanthopleuribacter pedis]|uniref:Pyridoxal-dependent decarboxylase n=1 Tax=Acanthopleuribacter pedis TaxID=442870 RepID=A0A8J7QLN3_9BACT|nr:pyridoxal-dependent decarboxylase [Acanthopleuribacter pedis]MBO1320588.1 hypothetical protein [Acanthopleuribacter pedis]